METRQRLDDILALLEERPYPTSQLAELLGVSHVEALELLRQLKAAGAVEARGRGRRASVMWRLASGSSSPMVEQPAAVRGAETGESLTGVVGVQAGPSAPPAPTQSQRILDVMQSGERFLTGQLTRLTGLAMTSMSRLLIQLEERNQIRRVSAVHQGHGRPKVVWQRTEFVDRPGPPAGHPAARTVLGSTDPAVDGPLQAGVNPASVQPNFPPAGSVAVRPCRKCGLEFAPRSAKQTMCVACRAGRPTEAGHTCECGRPSTQKRQACVDCRLVDDVRRFQAKFGRTLDDRPLTAAPAPVRPDYTATRTLVVDGVEYEAVSVGALSVSQWPEDLTSTSSLGNAR